MQLDKFILGIAEKAGIPANDNRLAGLLAQSELSRMQIPDEVTNDIHRSLLSLDDAKNNHPAIKSHYFGEVMSNVDRALMDAYKAAGFSDEEVNNLNAQERSSTRRIPLVISALKTKMEGLIEDVKKTAGKGGNTDALTQQITDLNNQLANLKTQMSAKEQEFSQNLNSYKVGVKLGSKFGMKTVYDTLPPEVRNQSLRTIIDNAIQNNGLQVTLDENDNLVLRRKDGSNYFDESNKLVSVDDFINRELAKINVLQQNPAPNGSGNGSQHQPAPNTNGEPRNNGQPVNNGSQSKTSNLTNLYKGALDSLTKNPVSIV